MAPLSLAAALSVTARVIDAAKAIEPAKDEVEPLGSERILTGGSLTRRLPNSVLPNSSPVQIVRDLLVDTRHGLYLLRRSPSFTLVALVTLAVCIGANVCILGVVNSVLLRQPPHIVAPEELRQVRIGPRMSGAMLTTSYPAFCDFRLRNSTFRDIAAVYSYSSQTLRRGDAAVLVRGYEVSGNYFDLLGVRPQFGRLFHGSDEKGPGSAAYIVLSDLLWRTAFNGDEDVIGETVHLDKGAYTVVGVAPPRFHGVETLERPDFWIPIVSARTVEFLNDRTRNAVQVLGRLKQGIAPDLATNDLNAVAAVLAREHPRTDPTVSVRLVRPGLFGDDGRTISRFLFGLAVLALLLLGAACMNLASLFAARAVDRSREFALRGALGASRSRIVRQLLTEALVISVLGGVAGFISAKAIVELLNRWAPTFVYGGQRLAIDVEITPVVYLTGLALALGGAASLGLLPTWRAWRGSPNSLIKGQTSSAGVGRRMPLRDLLLGAQIAVCTLLITAAIVGGRGLVRALQVPLGFRPEGVTLVSLDYRELGLGRESTLEIQRSMLDAARTVPGVEAAGAARSTPLHGGLRGVPVYLRDSAEPDVKNVVLTTRVYPVSPGYLDAAGTKRVSGRDFMWQDTAATPAVAIVNTEFARRLWGEAPAVGKRFLLLGRLTEVVGVAEDGKFHDLVETPQPAVFVSVNQHYGSDLTILLRSELSPRQLTSALRDVWGQFPSSVLLRVQSWTESLEAVFFPARASAAILGLIGALAGMLAATGVFGMAAYSVSRRMREFGIRAALGAGKAPIMRAAIGRPALLVAGGTISGLGLGLLGHAALAQLAFRAEPGDGVVLALSLLTMAFIGMVGSALPAHRALSVDPSRLMRDD